MLNTRINHTLSALFFKPLFELYPLSDAQRICHEMSDLEYLQLGIECCMSTAESGNGFLQNYRRDSGKKVRVSNFFESLKSKRRLENLASMNQLMKAYLSDR